MVSRADPLRSPVQKREGGQAALGVLSASHRQINPASLETGSRGGLPGALRSGIEALSGFAMDDVRVYRNSSEPGSLRALAFTRGSDIYLGPGQERHLAHEAWHVVQQKQGRVKPTLQINEGIPLNEDPGLEHEADRFAGSLAGSGRAEATAGAPTAAAPPMRPTANAPVQRRRIPDATALEAALPKDDRLGLIVPDVARMLCRAWSDLAYLNPQRQFVQDTYGLVTDSFGQQLQQSVIDAMNPLLVWTDEATLFAQLTRASWPAPTVEMNNPQRTALVELAAKIRGVNSQSTLGDPKELNVKADDKGELGKLEILRTEADKVFDVIISRDLNDDLAQVFGKDNVEAALTKYANGKEALNRIVKAHIGKGMGQRKGAPGGIITDRSRYVDEVGKAGEVPKKHLFTPRSIFLRIGFIENPADPESVIVAIHEAMHAGNSDVKDKGYIDSPGFLTLSVDEKLTNSAHFEVAARRHLKAVNAYAGQTFLPVAEVSATSDPADPAASVLAVQTAALRAVSETIRAARNGGMTLHEMLMDLFASPSKWTAQHAAGLPYWSDVEALTIHTRAPGAAPNSAGSRRGVSSIDIALSEGLLHKLRLASKGIPRDTDRLQFFADCHDQDGFAAAQGNATRMEDLILRLVLAEHAGNITGPVGRDMRVVRRLAQTADFAPEDFLINGGVRPF